MTPHYQAILDERYATDEELAAPAHQATRDLVARVVANRRAMSKHKRPRKPRAKETKPRRTVDESWGGLLLAYVRRDVELPPSHPRSLQF